MKKLLGIVVLGLLLSGNAYSKEIFINCFGIIESTKEKFNSNYIIDTTRGTWKMPRQTEPWDIFIINDSIIGRLEYFDKNYTMCFRDKYCLVGQSRLNRQTGEYVTLTTYVKQSELLKFHKDSKMFEGNDKFFNRAGAFINSQIIADKVSKAKLTYQKSNCEASKKKF